MIPFEKRRYSARSIQGAYDDARYYARIEQKTVWTIEAEIGLYRNYPSEAMPGDEKIKRATAVDGSEIDWRAWRDRNEACEKRHRRETKEREREEKAAKVTKWGDAEVIRSAWEAGPKGSLNDRVEAAKEAWKECEDAVVGEIVKAGLIVRRWHVYYVPPDLGGIAHEATYLCEVRARDAAAAHVIAKQNYLGEKLTYGGVEHRIQLKRLEVRAAPRPCPCCDHVDNLVGSPARCIHCQSCNLDLGLQSKSCPAYVEVVPLEGFIQVAEPIHVGEAVVAKQPRKSRAKSKA
jgi:hypothetical protein